MLHKIHSTFTRAFALIAFFSVFQLMATDAKAQSRLIHYWNFNNYTNNDTAGALGCTYPLVTPNRIRPIAADYSVIDTAKAKFAFAKQSGVSSNWPSVAVET